MSDEPNGKYLVRTLYLANFADAVIQVAEQRRNPSDVNGLRNALKKLDMADKTLENELNAYASHDLELAGIIRHEVDEHPRDLLVTAIFMASKSQPE